MKGSGSDKCFAVCTVVRSSVAMNGNGRDECLERRGFSAWRRPKGPNYRVVYGNHPVRAGRREATIVHPHRPRIHPGRSYSSDRRGGIWLARTGSEHGGAGAGMQCTKPGRTSSELGGRDGGEAGSPSGANFEPSSRPADRLRGSENSRSLTLGGRDFPPWTDRQTTPRSTRDRGRFSFVT